MAMTVMSYALARMAQRFEQVTPRGKNVLEKAYGVLVEPKGGVHVSLKHASS